MPRGQIPTSEISSFSPSAVGVPDQNRSGQIIAAGMQNLGQALKKRESDIADISAMSKYGDYEFEFNKKKRDLQEQYRDKPAEYPEALRTEGTKLAEAYQKDMDSEVATRFNTMATRSMIQEQDNAFVWSAGRENEIVIGEVKNSYQNKALTASAVGSPQELQDLLDTFDQLDDKSATVLNPDSVQSLSLGHRSLAIQNAMSAQIMSSPDKVYRDLQGGAYSGVLSADEISDYTSKARTAVHNRTEDQLYKRMYTAQGEVLDLQQAVDSGQATLTDLIARKQAAIASRGKKDANGNEIVTQSYVDSLIMLVDQMTLSHKAAIKALDPAAQELKKKEIDTAWDQYLREKPNKVASKADIVAELGLYAQISKAYGEGFLTESEFRQKVDLMRVRLNTKVGGLPQAMSFDEVLKQAGTEDIGGWMKQDANDVFVYGYQYIKNHIDRAYPNLSASERSDMQAQMLSQYTEQVKGLPEGIVKNAKDDNARRVLAHDLVVGKGTGDGKSMPGILAKFSTYVDPRTRQTLFFGDTISQYGVPKIFRGVNPETGRPQWALAPETVGKIVDTPKGAFQVIGIDANGEPLFGVLQNGR